MVLDWEPVAGPQAGTIDPSSRTYRQAGIVSPEELVMSLVNLSRRAGVVEHLEADASAPASTPIARMPGSVAERIAMRHIEHPYGVADAFGPLSSLRTMVVKFRHGVPPDFFSSLPPSLERLRLRVMMPLPLALEHVALLRAFDWSRLDRLRTLELPGAWREAAPSVRAALPPGCELEIAA